VADAVYRVVRRATVSKGLYVVYAVRRARALSYGGYALYTEEDSGISAVVSKYNVLLRQVQRWVDGSARCAAMVKANAYGLGALPVSQALYEAGCRAFFCGTY
jgi:alanine racemase